MTGRIMQCCYTNASKEVGGTIRSGWQPVAVSENIPDMALRACVSFQNANATIQDAMTDEQGNILNLMEIRGDGTYVYVMRTQYGLSDRLGRANMFSHAFILPWNEDDILADPNSFLTIDNINFKDNEADASVIPQALKRTKAFTLEKAMDAARIDSEGYLTLIRCVYTQMSERKILTPLFIQYDGSEPQMRAILYCIYYGLPYYLRKTLCTASAAANNISGKNIIFSTEADKHELYLIPQTGRNNILSERARRKIARYGFADYAARNIGRIDIQTYFNKLEDTAGRLGDLTASNELILKIAHQLMENENVKIRDNAELDERISDALRSQSYGSKLMRRYIAGLLDEVCKRELFLTDENEASLSKWLGSQDDATLEDAGERYNIYRFSALSTEEAAEKLGKMSPEIFEKYFTRLVRTTKGKEILDCHYSESLRKRQDLNWETLNHVYDEARLRYIGPETKDAVEARAHDLYCDSLKQLKDVRCDYRQYIKLMSKLVEPESISKCGINAKKEYWECVTFENFSPDSSEDYRIMRIDDERCRMFEDALNFIKKLPVRTKEQILKSVWKYFSKYRNMMANEEAAAALHMILRNCDERYCEKDMFLKKWIKVSAEAEDPDLFEDILEIRTLLYEKRFEELAAEYPPAKCPEGIIRRLNDVLLLFCRKTDSELFPVPLDIWLLIGENQYENSFTVFDKEKPAILKKDSRDVVSESRLLEDSRYIDAAGDYIRRRGAEAKTIKKWLSELKRIEKSNSAPQTGIKGKLRGFLRK